MTSSTATGLPKSRERRRASGDGVLLAAALAVPLLGSVMSADAAGDVWLPGIGSRPLPPLCPSRWVGLQCPTCGVTRSVIALMHGDVAGSLVAHRFGWLMLLLIVSQIPYRAYRLLRPGASHPALETAGAVALVGTAVIVVANRFLEVVWLR